MPEIARGSSAAFGLASLLHLVEGEAVTGRLSVGGGTVVLHRGNAVGAHARRLDGVPALLELFVRPSDGFVIEADEVPPGRPLGELSMLVLEGCRLQDEWARLAGLTLVPADGVTLPATLAPLARLLDGARTVSVALDAARLDRAALVDPLLRALETGVLVEVAPRPAAVPAAEAYDAAMDAARRCVREGRYDDARAHFLAALALRPDDRIAQQNLRRLTALHGSP